MAEIEDTYAEAYDGLFCRIMITAKDENCSNGRLTAPQPFLWELWDEEKEEWRSGSHQPKRPIDELAL